jgi:hypothetical protein
MTEHRECLEEVTQILSESGVDWEIERRSKHMIVKVCGQSVAALSLGSKVKHRTAKNTVARVRRFLRGLSDSRR